MKQELDKLLCERYPKMMINRYKPMTETCMCWGFDCGNGWFNILNQLMGNIQHHINWHRKQRANALKYNRFLRRAVNGDTTGLIRFYTYGDAPNEHTYKRVSDDLADPKFRDVPEKIRQVTLDQVKEKFGTLRFYYTGGDAYIDGLVTMAESMSAVTCEGCGNIGKRSDGGWIRTICASCDQKREEESAKALAEYHKMNEPEKEE